MFRRILVPIDGSNTSNRGLEQAIKLATEQKAVICLLHIVDENIFVQDLGGAMFTMPSFIEEVLNAMRDEGERLLTKAEAKVRKQGVACEKTMLETVGQPVADIITRQAKKWRADLIVLGTHGRRGIRRAVMGSDAEGVVRSAQVPVLLVRASDKTKAAKSKKR